MASNPLFGTTPVEAPPAPNPTDVHLARMTYKGFVHCATKKGAVVLFDMLASESDDVFQSKAKLKQARAGLPELAKGLKKKVVVQVQPEGMRLDTASAKHSTALLVVPIVEVMHAHDVGKHVYVIALQQGQGGQGGAGKKYNAHCFVAKDPSEALRMVAHITKHRHKHLADVAALAAAAAASPPREPPSGPPRFVSAGSSDGEGDRPGRSSSLFDNGFAADVRRKRATETFSGFNLDEDDGEDGEDDDDDDGPKYERLPSEFHKLLNESTTDRKSVV